MTLDENTTFIPAFSEEIFFPLRFLPKGDDKASHSIRCSVLQKALDAHFFGGRMFIFKSSLFHIPDQWRDKDSGLPLMLIGPEPAALGFKTTEDAIKGVEALLCEWGYGDFVVGYNGSPERKVWIDDNEHEAHVNAAVRASIRAKYGDEMAKKAIRMRCSNTRDSQYAMVSLSNTKLYRELVAADAPVWGSAGEREIELPLTLPDGRKTTFTLCVEREGLLPDLTAHYFNGRNFKKVFPFTMFSSEGYERETAHALMVHVHPIELGFKNEAEAHTDIRKQAIALGYSVVAMTCQIFQAENKRLVDLEYEEIDPYASQTFFRPTRP